MKQEILNIFDRYDEISETGRYIAIYENKFNQCAEEITQKFCDFTVQREYDHVRGCCSKEFFCDIENWELDEWIENTGFTKEQIMNSLEKLK